MAENSTYDLLLRGGHVICPASGLNGVMDVAIRDGKIAAVQPDILPASAKEVARRSRTARPAGDDRHPCPLSTNMSAAASAWTPTWWGFIPASPRVVDQGGPSCMTFPGFRHFVAEPAKTRVYAFLSSYLVGGLEGHLYPNLYSPDGIDIDATVRAADANRDLVRGIKGHAEIGGFARWGIKVLEMSAEIGRKTSLPVYVHFGQLWGLPRSGANGEDADTILERVIPELRPGDILAHPFTRHPGGFVNREGQVHEVIRAALDRGLKVDVGHGSHFSYRLARKALDAGIVPDTLGADMHGYNTYVPPPPGTPAEHADDEAHPFAGQAKFSLTQAMSSMLALGLSLEQVVPMVTTNAAAMIGLSDEIGTLRPGTTADVSVLSDDRGRFVLQDNEKTQVVAERLLQPLFCLRAGKRYDADAVDPAAGGGRLN